MKLISTKIKDRGAILYQADSQEAVMRHADSWLYTVKNVSLLGELNDLQMEATGGMDLPGIFENKFTLPLYFVNLILEKFNLKIIS